MDFRQQNLNDLIAALRLGIRARERSLIRAALATTRDWKLYPEESPTHDADELEMLLEDLEYAIRPGMTEWDVARGTLKRLEGMFETQDRQEATR